jgi:hypothetical protein
MESPTIPSDMLFEIFSRTSLQTIGRCRLVSKYLNSITYNSSFVQAFHQRTKTISGFFTQAGKIKSQFVSITDSANDDSLMSLKFLPGPVKIQAATNKESYYASIQTTQEDIEYLNIMSASLAPKNGIKYRILKHDSSPKELGWWCSN